MMNFDEIRKRNAAALEQYKGQPVKIQQRPPTYLSRVKHLIAHHLGEMTEWEANFCYSQIHYLTTWTRDRVGEQADDQYAMSPRTKQIVTELENKYCGSMCHALNAAGIPHK